MARSPRSPSRILAASVVAVLGLVVPGCASDDEAGPTTTAGDEAADNSHGHDGGASADGYGSSMAAETVSVADIAELGPGPGVGEAWTGQIGLNVCGRFLEPPAAAGQAGSGMSTDGTGTFTVAPTTEDTAGHAATVGALARQLGLSLGTGTVTFPASTTPVSIEQGAGDMAVAGATLTTGQRCGDTPAEVQLWIYTPDAANTGEDVRQVVTDPQDVPIVQDGMVFVVAVSPTSSLPTLPPSALNT